LIGVSAIIVRNGAVLLGRRRGSHGAGTWAFPGGKPDAGEHPSDTVRRELFEETGLIDAVGEPAVREPDKVEGWHWCAWDELPEPLFAPAASLIAGGWRPA
jgi:8-oxo-dGTP diphosphatase